MIASEVQIIQICLRSFQGFLPKFAPTNECLGNVKVMCVLITFGIEV